MKLVLFNNQSDARVVDKRILTRLTIKGTLKKATSITDPVIQISNINDMDAVRGTNYMYIEEFNRYYYITSIVSVANNLWEIAGHVDVLMSFKDEILEQEAIILRNQYNYNTELYDGRIVTEQKRYYQYLAYPNKFDQLQMYLAIAGN